MCNSIMIIRKNYFIFLLYWTVVKFLYYMVLNSVYGKWQRVANFRKCNHWWFSKKTKATFFVLLYQTNWCDKDLLLVHPFYKWLATLVQQLHFLLIFTQNVLTYEQFCVFHSNLKNSLPKNGIWSWKFSCNYCNCWRGFNQQCMDELHSIFGNEAPSSTKDR